VIINGVDVGTFGIEVNRELVGWKDGPTVHHPVEMVPGADALVLTGRRAVQMRTVSVSGEIAGDSDAEDPAEDARQKWNEFLFHVFDREVQITLAGHTDRYYRGFYNAARSTPIPPVLAGRAHDITVAFDCPNPFAFATAVTEVEFSAPAPVPLANAPVAPLLTVTAPTTIIYRDALGVERSRLVVGSFDSSTPLVLDCETGECNKAVELTGPLLRLDPRHGSLNGPWPTLEASAPCVCSYSKTYLTL
jgi:hypothetical protein